MVTASTRPPRVAAAKALARPPGARRTRGARQALRATQAPSLLVNSDIHAPCVHAQTARRDGPSFGIWPRNGRFKLPSRWSGCVMRDLKPESHGQAHAAMWATSGAGVLLMAIALLGAHTTALTVLPTVSLAACLLWQLTWFARRRMVPPPRGPYAVTNTLRVHVARLGQSECRLDRCSSKSWERTI